MADTDAPMVTITVRASAIDHALRCLDALADETSREPQRYREWYSDAAEEIRRALHAD